MNSDPLRLHHVALGALDVERVAAFYRDALGLAETARHFEAGGTLRSVWLDLGGAILMIERAAAARQPVSGVATGPFLLAFRVDAARRAAFERALAGAGAAVESATEFTAYARDPEGNRIAISHYPAARVP
jgi:catechol 2,3-dioxygenase-like lactoylglutathione lyase family enzyme